MALIDSIRAQAKAAVEALYDGLATITVTAEKMAADKTTHFTKKIIVENEPCRLSHNAHPEAAGTVNLATITAAITLFIRPDLEIPAGSKITITQNEVTRDYKLSGVPKIYATHQEVNLEIVEAHP